MLIAMENGEVSCINMLKKFEAEFIFVNREANLKELVKKMVDAPPDYKNSIFKHD
jgi:hypothetical protein